MANMNTLDASFLVFNSVSMPQTDLFTGQVNKTGNSDFKNVMESATSKTDEISKSPVENSKQVQSDESSIKDQTEKFASNKDAVSVKENEISDETKEELVAEVVGSINEIAELIENFTSISEEDLENLLDSLGMEKIDLLNMENVVKLIFEANGSENMGDLITNPDFAELTKDIASIIDNQLKSIQDALGTNETDLNELLQELILEPVGKDGAKLSFNKTLESAKNEALTDANEVSEDNLVQKFEVNNENENSNEELQDESSEEFFATKDLKEAPKADGQKNLGMSFAEATANISEIADDNNEVVSAMKIIEDIASEFKAMVKAETDSIEMQLYPAHLGKVGIQVASKEGMMTAKITVSSHEVEQIVKANLDILKENLNNQGLKVDDIEITIASRSFDDNFSGAKENESETQGNTKKTFKTFNDDDILVANSIDEQEELILKGATVSYEA